MVLFVILAFYRKRDLGSGVPNRGLTEIFPLAERSGDEKGGIWCQNEKCGPALPSSDSGVLSDRFSADMSEAAQKYLEYRSPVSSLKPEDGSFVYSTVRHICAPPPASQRLFLLTRRRGGEKKRLADKDLPLPYKEPLSIHETGILVLFRPRGELSS